MAKYQALSSQFAQKKINEYQQKISYWKMVEQLMTNIEAFDISQIPSGFMEEISDFPTYVYVLYLKLGSVSKVVQELKTIGIRKKGGKPEGNVIVSNDVSYIIRNIDIPDKNLLIVARNQINDNTDRVNKIYN